MGTWDEENFTWRVLLRTQKSGEPVFLPVPEGLKFVLDALPSPRNAPRDCPYYFWKDTRPSAPSWGSRNEHWVRCSRNQG